MNHAEKLFDPLTEARKTVLLKVVMVVNAIIEEHLNDSNFCRLVKFAHEENIVNADKLGNMARVDRTTANRWINGISSPNSITQETVLRKIAEEATVMAKDVK